jgi:hypothetical protein
MLDEVKMQIDEMNIIKGYEAYKQKLPIFDKSELLNFNSD